MRKLSQRLAAIASIVVVAHFARVALAKAPNEALWTNVEQMGRFERAQLEIVGVSHSARLWGERVSFSLASVATDSAEGVEVELWRVAPVGPWILSSYRITP